MAPAMKHGFLKLCSRAVSVAPVLAAIIIMASALGNRPASGMHPSGTTQLLDERRSVPQSWTLTTLYKFQGGLIDGYNPLGSLVHDAAGNLYGTTEAGGTGSKCIRG